MDEDMLPFGAPSPEAAISTAKPRRHRHVYDSWTETQDDPQSRVLGYVPACLCGAIQDPDASRRGRSSLRAGKDAERAIAKSYGGQRVGQYGGIEDVVVGDLFVIQSKAGRTWFREAVWDELAKLPRNGGRIPTLVVSDRPGPGRKTRRYVIRTIEDDIALHGETP